MGPINRCTSSNSDRDMRDMMASGDDKGSTMSFKRRAVAVLMAGTDCRGVASIGAEVEAVGLLVTPSLSA